jgi:hypothetical protein
MQKKQRQQWKPLLQQAEAVVSTRNELSGCCIIEEIARKMSCGQSEVQEEVGA